MAYHGIFEIATGTLLELHLLVLGLKATNKDPALTPTLDALLAWLSTGPSRAGRAAASAVSHTALAELLAGVTFPDDRGLETVRTTLLVYLRRPPTPPPPPPGPTPHPAVTVNLLADHPPWIAGSLTQISPAFTTWLTHFCLGGPTTLILADMDALPGAMRAAGFSGRDNALTYCLSRSYADWPWAENPSDPDAHLSGQRAELKACWSNYLDAVRAAMQAAPATRALFLLHDAEDRCGDVLSEYSLRQLQDVAARCDRGEVFS